MAEFFVGETNFRVADVLGGHLLGHFVGDGFADVGVEVFDFVGSEPGQVEGADGGVDRQKFDAVDQVFAVVTEIQSAAALVVVDAPFFGASAGEMKRSPSSWKSLPGTLNTFHFLSGESSERAGGRG